MILPYHSEEKKPLNNSLAWSFTGKFCDLYVPVYWTTTDTHYNVWGTILHKFPDMFQNVLKCNWSTDIDAELFKYMLHSGIIKSVLSYSKDSHD